MINNRSLFTNRNQKMPLGADEVHIWSVTIDRFLNQVDMLVKMLSTDEKKRTDHFYREKDKERYIICRGTLRTIISLYLGIAADRLQFDYGHYGKPVLLGGGASKKLKFNMSHSHDMALFAFVRGGEVGIDIEQIRDILEIEQIAEGLFSDPEKKYYYSLPENKKKEFFFNIWTRKESLFKAIGEGFHLLPDKYDVLRETVVLTDPAACNFKNTQWYIKELSLSPCYAAAYTVERPLRLRHYVPKSAIDFVFEEKVIEKHQFVA